MKLSNWKKGGTPRGSAMGVVVSEMYATRPFEDSGRATHIE
jgi:hypothetical protein